MTRCGAPGAYLLSVGNWRVLIWNRVVVRDRAFFFFWRTSRMCETKLGCLYEKEKRKTGLFSLHPSWWKRRAKQTRETFHSSEGTVHSHIHNSWETETKATVLATGEKWTKMYYRWSQCTFTLTVLSPKQIRGAHLNETAYPKGALIRTRTLIKKKNKFEGGAYWV